MRLLLAGAVLLALTARDAVAQPRLSPRDGLPLAELVRQQRADVSVPDDSELRQGQAAVLAAYRAFSGQLAEVPDGVGTAEELGLPSLAHLLDDPMPDLEALAEVEKQLRRNSPGAKGAAYDRLCDEMRRCVQLVRASRADDLPGQFTAWMDRLETAFTQYKEDRSAANLAAVAKAHDWLSAHGQVPELLARLRLETVHVNHRMRFSEGFLNRLVGQRVSTPLSSDDQSQGAQVRVRGMLNGSLNSVLVPDEQRGVIHIGFRGIGNSNITAVKGIATVRARGRTEIDAGQPVYLTAAGFAVGAPRSTARHRTSGSCVSLRMRSRLLRRLLTSIANKVVARQQAASDRQASEKTRRQVEERLRSESTKFARQGNQTLESFGIFAALGPNPASRLRLRTTEEYLEWLGRYAGDTQFASPAGPPDGSGSHHAVLFQLHESAVNNSQKFIAGQLVNEADFREAVYTTFGLVPNDEAPDGRSPASVVFAEDNPLRIAINDGQIAVTARLDGVNVDGQPRPSGPYTVTTAYRFDVGDGPVKLIRTGPISIEPAGSSGVEGLEATLARFFVNQAEAGGSRPLDAFLAPAVLRLHELSLVEGWLTLSLKLEEGASGD